MNRLSPCRAISALLLVLAVGLPTFAQTSKSRKTDLLEQTNDRAFLFGQLPRLVVVGDSLSAGFQNGSLLDRQQRNGYAALVARRAGSLLLQPEVGEPGIPNVLTLVSPGPPPVIVPAPGTSIGRTNVFLPPTNLAVPGATLRDALVTRPNLPVDSLTDIVLGLPWLYLGVSQSQVEFAEDLRPKNLIVWIGNNDALGAALAGNATDLTPLPQFTADYTALLNRLNRTKARLIVANIPDVTTTAYLISAQEVATLVGVPLFIIGPLLGISANDYVTPAAVPLIAQILQNPASGPLPANVVLTAAEVATIQTAVNSYNQVIAQKTAEKNGVLVDVNALVRSADQTGFPLGDGRVVTTNFLGGLFSLDGVHPTNTGYAIIANEFIRKINQRYRTTIPLVNLIEVANNDPLIPGNYFGEKLEVSAPAEAAESLQKTFNFKP